jgi:hypothetical protein
MLTAPRPLSPATIALIAGAIRPGETVTVREVVSRLAIDYCAGTVRAVLGAMAVAGLASVEQDLSDPRRLPKRYRLC